MEDYGDEEPTKVDIDDITIPRCIECGTMSIEDSFSGDALIRARQLFVSNRCIHGKGFYICGEKQKLVYYYGSNEKDEAI